MSTRIVGLLLFAFMALGLSPPAQPKGSTSNSSSNQGSNSSSQNSNSGNSSSTADKSSNANGSAGFSIEAELLAYKSLESNSEAIACDIAGYLFDPKKGGRHPHGVNQDLGNGQYKPLVTACEQSPNSPSATAKGVVIVSSTSNALANVQLWKMNMLIAKTLVEQAKQFNCPIEQGSTIQTRSFDVGTTVATAAIGVVQGLLGLFANNESVSGVPGTIGDQALMNGVARQLKNQQINVLMPDTYGPFTLDYGRESDSPFLLRFQKLLDAEGCLQMKLAPLQDILGQMQAPPASTSGSSPTAADKAKANEKNKNALGELKELDPSINSQSQLQVRVSQVSALVTRIDSYVVTLITGAPTQSDNKSSSSSSGQQGSSNDNKSGNTGQQPSAASNNNPPSILAILAGDGLMRGIGVDPSTGELTEGRQWHVLSLNALESGGSLVTEANILGSKVYFGGGAVATYALFRLSGRLSCSGNVYDYGGYIRATKFDAKIRKPDIDPTQQLIYLRGGCSSTDELRDDDPTAP
jgi:hypothetical protein